MKTLPEDIRSKLVDALVSAEQRWAFDAIALVNRLSREQSDTYVAYIRESAPKASAPDDFLIIVLTPLVRLTNVGKRESLEIEVLKAWRAGRVSEHVGEAFSAECRSAHDDWVARNNSTSSMPSGPRAPTPRRLANDVKTRVAMAERFLESKCGRLTTTLRATELGYPWGNGYLLGVLDAARHQVIGNVPPETNDYAAAMVVFGSVHGEMRGARVLQVAMQAQDVGDRDFLRGMRTGGTEATNFFRGASAPASFEPPPTRGPGIVGVLRKWFGGNR